MFLKSWVTDNSEQFTLHAAEWRTAVGKPTPFPRCEECESPDRLNGVFQNLGAGGSTDKDLKMAVKVVCVGVFSFWDLSRTSTCQIWACHHMAIRSVCAANASPKYKS